MTHEPLQSANRDPSAGQYGKTPVAGAATDFQPSSLPGVHDRAASASRSNKPSLLQKAKRADLRRPGIPGEHLAVFTAALSLFKLAHRSRSALLRWAARGIGAALVVRSMTGRDGPLHKIRKSRPSSG